MTLSAVLHALNPITEIRGWDRKTMIRDQMVDRPFPEVMRSWRTGAICLNKGQKDALIVENLRLAAIGAIAGMLCGAWTSSSTRNAMMGVGMVSWSVRALSAMDPDPQEPGLLKQIAHAQAEAIGGMGYGIAVNHGILSLPGLLWG